VVKDAAEKFLQEVDEYDLKWLQKDAQKLTVAEQQPVSWALILAKGRLMHVVEARKRVCKKLREEGWSYPAIARALNRSHKSIWEFVNGSKRSRKKTTKKGRSHGKEGS
jgi:chromosomal replication initiation ATPase DnaA